MAKLAKVAFFSQIMKWVDRLGSRRGTQEALQWWETQQAIHAKHQAEQIREDLLQELFTMRRSLELLPAGLPLEQPQGWLNKIEQLHRSLEQIGDALAPPYVEESLPLAIQYFLDQLQQQYPHLTVQMQLADQIDHAEQNRVILTALAQLLQIALAAIASTQSPQLLEPQLLIPQPLAPQLLQVSLIYRENQAELTVFMPELDADTLKILKSRALNYLEQSFHLLTSGWCTNAQKDRTWTWSFYWRLASCSQLQPDRRLAVINAKEEP